MNATSVDIAILIPCLGQGGAERAAVRLANSFASSGHEVEVVLLNDSGDFKSLFVPYGGDESNGTIFITSPIWDTPELFIQSDVVNEKILSIFLLSDGMEKITFECSNLTEEVFIDANIPFKKFFYPILSKINSLDIEGERKLIVEWKNFIENGNEAIKNESDDKTLLISFLK